MDNDEESSTPLSVEETPIIDEQSGEVTADVVPEAARVFAQRSEESKEESRPPETPKRQRKFHVGTVLFVFILFGLGVWLSTQLRSFLTPAQTEPVAVPTLGPSGNVTVSPQEATGSAISDSESIIYGVKNGVSGVDIPGISFRLPLTVSVPVCDGSSCPSQGTYLPGGTRFTVAPRGKGQLLPDFRGAILTDAAGKEFTMQQTTVGGIPVYEYTGNFTGSTGGGYTFTAMRGVLIPIDDNLAIEFNHFAPVGKTTDFVSDDTLFDQIIASFTSTVPTPSPTTMVFEPTLEATTSGL